MYEKQTFTDHETVLTAAHLQHMEDGIAGALPAAGWSAGKYLATDETGTVVETEAPGGPGEVSWESVQNKPFYEKDHISRVSFEPLPEVTFDGAGYTWWKCSDLVLTRAQILETTVLTVFAPGTEFAEVPQETDIVVDEEHFTGVLFASGSNAGYIFCRATGEYTVSFAGNPVTFTCPETGVYLGYPADQTPPDTISVGMGYQEVRQLDAKFLPMEAIEEKIQEALGVIEHGTY